jgi:hypothetical protein
MNGQSSVGTSHMLQEREREKYIYGGGSERHYHAHGGSLLKRDRFEGSQAMPASPSGGGRPFIGLIQF